MKNILETAYREALQQQDKTFCENTISKKVEVICRCESNKAPIRFLIAGLLSKINDASIDLHKPYSAMGEHSYTGRSNDEEIVQPFIHKYSLPCNPTTAYLTPAFRTKESPLSKEFFDNCRPKNIYYEMMDVIEYVEAKPMSAKDVLSEIIRFLLIVKNENDNRLHQLINAVSADEKDLELSAEEITTLLIQHIKCKGSSRLPVLIVAAAYKTIEHLINEKPKPLFAHNAADKQTGALGDIEIILSDSENTVTCYEMKKKRVTTDDINVAVQKILNSRNKIDNYIIVTTDVIEKEVSEFAKTFYGNINVEIVVLDCIGFINHFLHFFHRYRIGFLDNYQKLVLAEPESAVSQPLKEAFLSLRRVAQANRN